ncbi:MAG: hypothetical protein QM718_05145 [Steroidobacteraceae bacterium]
MKLVTMAGLMIFGTGAALAQNAAPANAAAEGMGAPPGMGPGGPGGSRAPREVPARTNPGITQCATIADFLAYKDLPCAQTGGLPLPAATPAQLEKN